MALVLWQIWAACNDVIWNDVYHTSTSIGRIALDVWHQWQEVHKHPSPLVVQHGQNRVQGSSSVWEKPRETWLKCNVKPRMTVTIFYHLRVVLGTLVYNLFRLKQDGSGKI